MTTSMIITPALGVKFFTDGGIRDFARQRIGNLTEHAAAFPDLSPSPVELELITDEYHDALKLCGVDATRSQTTIKNEKRRALEKALTLSAHGCAQIADNSLSHYLLSGFRYKGQGTKTTKLEVPVNMRYKQAPFDGSVYILFKSVRNARSYEVGIGENADPDTWTDYNINSGTPVLMTDLKPMSIYYVRSRAIGARNIKSAWSSTVQIKVI